MSEYDALFTPQPKSVAIAQELCSIAHQRRCSRDAFAKPSRLPYQVRPTQLLHLSPVPCPVPISCLPAFRHSPKVASELISRLDRVRPWRRQDVINNTILLLNHVNHLA